ncbi:hypothetical protein LCGC14_0702330 [marine sediment metagenome]|uniref:Proliferating cell nuclear antigen PCNA N-terminal domain-containing protein n=1 Tax=marine sediment metagenome TaxID=412755 RepID=A0A0F9QHE5_9ZZZZ
MEQKKKKKKEVKKQQGEANSKELLELLGGVHLNGTIDECVLQIENGKGSIQAVDMSNSLCVCCEGTVEGLEEGRHGLINIGTICKFLDGVGDDDKVKLSIRDGKQLSLKANKSEIRTTLLSPDEIPTAVSKSGIKKKLLEQAEGSFAITLASIKEVVYCHSLVPVNSAVFYENRGWLFARSPEGDQEFNVRLGKADNIGPETSVEVYTTYLIPILKYLLQQQEGDEKILVYMNNGKPLIISYRNNLWAITPIAS